MRHLDEGYSGIRDKFDLFPHYENTTSAAAKHQEEEIKKREAEQLALLDNLTTRAKLAEGEKQEIFSKLAEKSIELEQARLELRRLHQMNGEPPIERNKKQCYCAISLAKSKKTPLLTFL